MFKCKTILLLESKTLKHVQKRPPLMVHQLTNLFQKWQKLEEDLKLKFWHYYYITFQIFRFAPLNNACNMQWIMFNILNNYFCIVWSEITSLLIWQKMSICQLTIKAWKQIFILNLKACLPCIRRENLKSLNIIYLIFLQLFFQSAKQFLTL